MILPRLVLGTARIAGGIDERRGIALVRSALDAGITHIDTAPSYGLGTAEIVVGKAIVGFGRVGVTTKLGSHRPGQAWLRTALRRIKRGIATAETIAASLPPPRIAGPSGNDFALAAMARSFALSRDRLGRIDVLLLHDVSAPEVTKAVLTELLALAGTVEATPGYAGYAQWDAALDAAFPAEAIAQCAPDPRWLSSGAAVQSTRPLWLHSVVKTGLALAASDPQFAIALDRAAAMVEARDLPTARLAALYALAARRVPDARLLVTSSHRDRLDGLLAAIAGIDRGNQVDEIAALFAPQAG